MWRDSRSLAPIMRLQPPRDAPRVQGDRTPRGSHQAPLSWQKWTIFSPDSICHFCPILWHLIEPLGNRFGQFMLWFLFSKGQFHFGCFCPFLFFFLTTREVLGTPLFPPTHGTPPRHGTPPMGHWDPLFPQHPSMETSSRHSHAKPKQIYKKGMQSLKLVCIQFWIFFQKIQFQVHCFEPVCFWSAFPQIFSALSLKISDNLIFLCKKEGAHVWQLVEFQCKYLGFCPIFLDKCWPQA